MDENDEVSLDVSAGIDYIARHPEITNVLLTGGDPLLLSTPRLANIFRQLQAIPHVRIIRIGTKMPAFNPWRVLDDPSLLEAIEQYRPIGGRIYVMTHFDHPRELTGPAREGVGALLSAGAVCCTQFPLVRGINDDADTLRELFRELSYVGAPPYYVFQGRPTLGNEPYTLPLVEGYRLFEEVRRDVSGLAKRASYVMSHETGKLEVLTVDERFILLRYRRAKDLSLEGRTLVFHRNDDACWLDDLVPVVELGTRHISAGDPEFLSTEPT